MNALLLGGACLGALAVFLTADPAKIAAARGELRQGEGSMTREYSLNSATGQVEETDILAFRD